MRRVLKFLLRQATKVEREKFLDEPSGRAEREKFLDEPSVASAERKKFLDEPSGRSTFGRLQGKKAERETIVLPQTFCACETIVLFSSCVPPVASDQRSSGLLVFMSSKFCFLVFLDVWYSPTDVWYSPTSSCFLVFFPETKRIRKPPGHLSMSRRILCGGNNVGGWCQNRSACVPVLRNRSVNSVSF